MFRAPESSTTGLDHKIVREFVADYARPLHLIVDEYGFDGEYASGISPDDGAANEGIIHGSFLEEGEGVSEVAMRGERGEGDEFGLELESLFGNIGLGLLYFLHGSEVGDQAEQCCSGHCLHPWPNPNC